MMLFAMSHYMKDCLYYGFSFFIMAENLRFIVGKAIS